MTGQQYQRREPVAWDTGWEIAVLAGAGIAIAVSVAALGGLAVSDVMFGHGWVWPHGVAIDHTLGGLLTGQPGRGLPPAAQSQLPARHLVYGCVVAAETLLLAMSIAGTFLVMRYRDPADHRSGMATRRETSKVLGRRRLREAAPLIRPDLPPIHGRWDRNR